jgi:hypothetical protein
MEMRGSVVSKLGTASRLALEVSIQKVSTAVKAWRTRLTSRHKSALPKDEQEYLALSMDIAG